MPPAPPLRSMAAAALALALLAPAALFLVSPPVRLWLGGPPGPARRSFPHHLLPLEGLASELLDEARRSTFDSLDTSVQAYRSWMQRLELLERTRLRPAELRQARGHIELRLAGLLGASGRESQADWHLLEAARHLESPGELQSVAALARRHRSWQALGLALAALPAGLRNSEALLPPAPGDRAEALYWLGNALEQRGETAAAGACWTGCAQLGMAACSSSLARQAFAAGQRGQAVKLHKKALELDPQHWPSLLALSTKEDKP